MTTVVIINIIINYTYTLLRIFLKGILGSTQHPV
jgi:hypothetical protein